MEARSDAVGMNRRRFLVGVGSTSAAMLLGQAGVPILGRTTPAAVAVSTDGNPYEQLRLTWKDFLTGGDFDPTDPVLVGPLEQLDASAADLIGAIVRSPDRDRVFVDMPLTESATLAGTCNGLETMARAYSTPGSQWYHDTDVLSDVLAGLETTNREVYNAEFNKAEFFGGWFHWLIGAPTALMNACSLVYENIEPDALARYLAAIDHFLPDPGFHDFGERWLSRGANRINMCTIVLIRGILGGRDDRMQLALGRVTQDLRYRQVPAAPVPREGFYRDGSYIAHHSIAYTGTYGVVDLGDWADLLALLAGSPWEITHPGRQIVFDAVDRSFAPVIYDAQMMSFVRGRQISSPVATEHTSGHGAIDAILRLVPAVDPETGARWRAVCKGWIERDTYHDILAGVSIGGAVRLKQLLTDESVEPAPEPLGFKLFRDMDRVVHRGHGWCYSIAMVKGVRSPTMSAMGTTTLRAGTRASE